MEECLNPSSIVPLYAQIVAQLNADIADGLFSKTGQLPTEAALSEQYKVSRITIRRAIEELVNNGLVEKKQGKGTFICATKRIRQLDSSPISFSEMCAANGLTASAKILEAGISSSVPAAMRKLLDLSEQEAAVRICRLRYADGLPLVLEDNFYPLTYAFLLSIDLENDSTYRYLREEKGITLRRTAMRLSIVRADSKVSKLLLVARNTPQLEMKGCVVGLDGKAVHSSYQIGYGENFEFIVR